MQAHKVARVDEVPPGTRKIVSVGSKEIGIFNVNDTFHAILNICPHAFAPICNGRIEGRVTSNGPHDLQYDATPTLLMCPWHLWEFDLETGGCLVDRKMKLKKYPVEVRGGDIFIYA